MSLKAIFKALKKRFGKKERARPSGPFLYNVMWIPEVRKETELAMELRGRSAASMMVDAECAQLREMLGRKVDMVDSESSEAVQSISSQSIVAPSDDASSLGDIIEENEKDMGPIRSAVADTKNAVTAMSRRLKHDVNIAAPSEKAVLARIGFGANAERACSPTEKEVLKMMGFPKRTKKDAVQRCDEEPAKIKEYDAQIGAQASVSGGDPSSARVQRLSGGLGSAQAPTHPAMARQEPIVERCDAGNSATIGVGVKTGSSLFVPDLRENDASLSHASIRCKASSKANPRRNLAKDTNIPRLALSSTGVHKISALRRSSAVVTRITGKENVPAHFYQRPRVAPAPPPTMSPSIRKAVQAMKEWDADIAEDPFWAQA